MINFIKNNCKFNFRAVAIIIKNGSVLLHKLATDYFWALPGGRVEFFEFSKDTVVRELKEEINLTTEVVRPLWIFENFFEWDGTKFHQVSTYFLMKIIEENSLVEQSEFNGIEKNVDLIFKWFKIKDLPNVDLFPVFLREELSNLPTVLVHKTLNELNS